MKSIQNISSIKLLIILVGLLTALFVVGQPILCEQLKTCDIKVEQEDDQSETDNETVSILEAVSPAPQVQNVSTDYYILDEVFMEEEVLVEKASLLVEKISERLIRVLFNFIIAPNAP